MAGAQHQVDLAEMFALQVDEAAAIEDIEVENELFAEGIGQHAHAFA